MPESVTRILLVAAGGALGATARVLLSSYVHRSLVGDFPWGTLLVNLLGAFLFGVCWCVLGKEVPATNFWKMFFLGGFLGAFTTFSTFAFEGAELLGRGRLAVALLYIGLKNVVGLALVVAGISAGELFLRLAGRNG